MATSRTKTPRLTTYAVIYEPGPRNWSAYVPDLPGCVATGRTRIATARRVRSAIRFHLEGMRLAGLAVPDPTSKAGAVSVRAG